MAAYGTEALMSKVADTGEAGYQLADATGTILSWTAPDDGQLHAFLVIGAVVVTSTETGGAIQSSYSPPGSGGHTASLDSGAHGAGTFGMTAGSGGVVAPGSTVTVTQNTALTGGAATAFAQIWAA
jgi:hypothetical protein